MSIISQNQARLAKNQQALAGNGVQTFLKKGFDKPVTLAISGVVALGVVTALGSVTMGFFLNKKGDW
eukprot:CAMPEP_0177652160 /NCGR_PEP_ID=MMETSP0447-20121125/12960_1 /TAXON_ID=0 /ORGANISM="Stygamoeba regulata, Strain BSH-02190019" /LENGTH=66 /DNA_ID=CAMNT_0019155343 /DNA_START=194 /DNA_END=394 /DNA_ORIENTATION=+